MAKKTETESPVQAREQLQQLENQGDDQKTQLEERAQEQEKLQAQELSHSIPGADQEQKFIDEGNVAAARQHAGFTGNGPQAGFVDQITRRTASDALEGHFVRIDLNADGVKEAYKQVQGLYDADTDEVHRGDYGVYLTPAALDENGYPVTAVVRLRDETNAVVAVPYEALRPAEAGSR